MYIEKNWPPPSTPYNELPSTKPEHVLRAVFKEDHNFIGNDIKEIDYFIERAGRFSDFGSFDHGVCVYQWKTSNFTAEVWFDNDKCSEIRAIDTT
jgi:hypothetical protein